METKSFHLIGKIEIKDWFLSFFTIAVIILIFRLIEFGLQIFEFSGQANLQRPLAKRKSLRDASKVLEDKGEKSKTQVS